MGSIPVRVTKTNLDKAPEKSSFSGALPILSLLINLTKCTPVSGLNPQYLKILISFHQRPSIKMLGRFFETYILFFTFCSLALIMFF